MARRGEIQAITARLEARHPAVLLDLHLRRHAELRRLLVGGTLRRLDEARARLSENARALKVISPLGTLERGYAIVTRSEGGALVRAASSVAAGESVDARLAEGALRLTVDETLPS